MKLPEAMKLTPRRARYQDDGTGKYARMRLLQVSLSLHTSGVYELTYERRTASVSPKALKSAMKKWNFACYLPSLISCQCQRYTWTNMLESDAKERAYEMALATSADETEGRTTYK